MNTNSMDSHFISKVGARADSLRGDGDALGEAMMLVVPAIGISGLVLWWAQQQSVSAEYEDLDKP